MMPSRGMGAISPSKRPGRKGTSCFKKGGKVWDTPNPKKKSKPLTSKQKASAKARAKAAGRPYPNLVDNMRAAKK